MFAHVLFFIKLYVNAFISDGSVQTKKRKRRTTVTGEVNEIAVLAAVHQNPQISTRQLHRDSEFPKIVFAEYCIVINITISHFTASRTS